KDAIKTNLIMYYGVCEAIHTGKVEIAQHLLEKVETFTLVTDFMVQEVLLPLVESQTHDPNISKATSVAATLFTTLLTVAAKAYVNHKNKCEMDKVRLFLNEFKHPLLDTCDNQLITDISKQITFRHQDQVGHLAEDGIYKLAQIITLRIANF